MKRHAFLSVFMSIVMVVSLMPLPAYAGEGSASGQPPFDLVGAITALAPAEIEAQDTTDAYAILYSNGDLVFQRGDAEDSSRGSALGKWTGFENMSNGVWPNKWYEYASSVKKAVFKERIAPNSLSGFFFGCLNMQTIEGIAFLDTSSVRDMSNMFNGCWSLASLDVSKFDTSNVTNMFRMFSSCSSLASLDVSKFNTSNVTNMFRMFHGCSSLAALDVSKFVTTNVTSMAGMFSGCSSLAALDVSSFNTSNVTNMSEVFNFCSSLTSLDLSGFSVSSDVSTEAMFYDCPKLFQLTVGPNFWFGTGSNRDCMLAPTALEGYKWRAPGKSYTTDELISQFNANSVSMAGTYIWSNTEIPAIVDIAGATVTLSQTSYTYDGTAKAPSVTSVTLPGGTAVPASSYDVSYQAGRVDAGTYTVTVTGKSGYAGTASTTFAIEKAYLNGATVTLSQSSYTYDGAVKQPSVSAVTLYGKVVPSSGYSITYQVGRVNAGTYTVTVTGKGNYQGSASAAFSINKASLIGATVVLSQSNYVYDGSAKTPGVTSVVLSSGGAVPSSAYEISYSNNVNVGNSATVTVTAKPNGNYRDSTSTTFAITEPSKVDITGATVALSRTSYTYDGAAKQPGVTSVRLANGTLVPDTGYTVSYSPGCTNAGTYTVTVAGAGNYQGSASASFTIDKASLSGTTVALSQTSYTYDGVAKQPGVTSVTLAGKTLAKGTDYAVSYSNNVNAGTATVTVTGKGNYTGTAKATFTINRASLTAASVTVLPKSYTYDGKAKEPAVTVTLAGKTVPSAGYDVKYSNNKEVGTATATVTGKGNYTGAASATFSIAKPVEVGNYTQQDGWRFVNEGYDISWEMCAQLFRYAEVDDHDGKPHGAAQANFVSEANASKNGVCFGMATTAAATAVGQPASAEFGASRLYGVESLDVIGRVPVLGAVTALDYVLYSFLTNTICASPLRKRITGTTLPAWSTPRRPA